MATFDLLVSLVFNLQIEAESEEEALEKRDEIIDTWADREDKVPDYLEWELYNAEGEPVGDFSH